MTEQRPLRSRSLPEEVRDPQRYAKPRKRVLILSSTEGIEVAKAVAEKLEGLSHGRIATTLWNRTQPKEGWLLLHVIDMIQRHPFVVVVLTPDAVTRDRHKSLPAPRDNLLFELGVAVSTNDQQRTFVIQPQESIKLPSDIGGWLLHTYYRPRRRGNHRAAVSRACQTIAAEILKLPSEMNWAHFHREILSLGKQVMRSRFLDGGLEPHVIVAVNMGGMVAGGLLYYPSRHAVHLMSVWTKDESRFRTLAQRQADFCRELREVVRRVRAATNDAPRILLVDDSDKTSEAMSKAVQLVRRVAGKDAVVQTAAIVYLGPKKLRPNHCGEFTYERFKYAWV
jgi:predicted nucleotide-binding protein/hypoxanthine phosphoribosyltransferase